MPLPEVTEAPSIVIKSVGAAGDEDDSDSEDDGEEEEECHVCLQGAGCECCRETFEESACSFCMKTACEPCLRTCARCGGTFCTFCSTCK